MSLTGQPRLAAVVIALLFLVPAIPITPASGGSTWSTAGPDFQNGTVQNTTRTPAGIRLPYNETHLNNWTRMDPWPTGRSNANMVYDPIDGVMILFGGTVWSNIGNNETWTYNLSTNRWRNMNPTKTLPADSPGYNMVFDSVNGVVILFETTYGNPKGNTWTYNLSANTWNQMNPFPAPPGRTGASMCFDSKDGVVILFGGSWGGGINDTWTYNLSANAWTQMAPAVSPSARTGAGMEYDPVSDKAVLFGGWDYTGAIYNDTWSYDFRTDTWANRTPASSPPARWLDNKNMVFNPVSGRLSIFGGVGDNWQYLNDTWEYDHAGNSWARITTHNTPSIRPYAAIAFDTSNGGTVLFGGYGQDLVWDETWFCNSTTEGWTKKNLAPSYRGGSNMVYDDISGLFILFGGVDWFMPSLNDTWTYDPASNVWTEKHPPKSPSYASSYDEYLMVFDSANGVVVAYGSYDRYTIACTWSYNLTDDSWTYKNPGLSPCQRGAMAMAYDSQNKVTLLFGGATPSTLLNDTWMYDYPTNKWTERKPVNSPPLRFGSTMVYDKKDGVMVLVGGFDPAYAFVNETWTYNFTTNTWTNMTPAKSPGQVERFSMVYDDLSGKVILFGGLDTSRGYLALNDTWTYDTSSNTWAMLAPVSSPHPTNFAAMACDGKSGTLILYGGSGPSTIWGDTWAFNLTRYISPGCYTSAPMDSGGSAHFGTIEWNGTVPPNTSIMFQFRSNSSQGALNATAFIGPDGTNGTYYNTSGQHLFRDHNGSRWFQYRTYLCTTDPACTPLLKGVTVNYNLLHNATLSSPGGGENWTGLQDICWTFSDPDGDGMFVDIDLLGGTDEVRLAYGLAADDYRWEWDTSSTENGTYRIRITVRDDNATIPLSINITSPEFTVFHPHVNEAPSAELVYPENGAVLTSPVVNLTWAGSDPENDTLDYTVYVSGAFFDIDNLPADGNVTYNTYYELTELADLSTYWWTVVPCDGQLPGPAPEVRNFTLDIPHAPEVELLFPSDSAHLNSTTVELKWHGYDADNDALFYLVYLDTVPFGPFDLPEPTVNTTAGTYIIAGLENRTTYFWTVVPCDNTTRGARAQARSFTIDISIGNRLPRFTSTAPLNVTVDELYGYNLTAVDDDGDPMTFSKLAGPDELTVNETTGKVSWRPNATGNFTMTVRATDSKGGFSDQTFTIEVKSKPPVIPRPPTLSITSAINNTKVKKTITIEGKAAVGSRPVTSVQFSVDGGPWQTASGTANWSFTLDTTTLRNGMHTIKVRAFDGTSYSDETSLNVEVSNAAAAPIEAGFPWWILALVVVVAAAVGAGFMLTRKKRAGAPGDEAEAMPPGEPVGTKTEPDEDLSEPEAEPLPPEAEEIAIKVEEKPEQVKAPAAPPIVPPAPALKTAPVGFAVEDIFLMYIDGRLIQHNTRRMKADMDADIMASMLTAVQAFIKESIGMEKGTELGAMEYGDNKILLQKGKHVVMAVVIEGSEPPEFRDEIRHAVSNIESEFGPVLASWDGMATKLAGAKKFLGRLGEYAPAQRPAGQAAPVKDVSVKAELEFYQGFIRLKVAIKNLMGSVITHATFKLIYDRDALRFDHLEPKIPMEGGEVQVGVVGTGEKKTIAFYLDPQICMESYMEGVLTYKDAQGNLETQKLPRKLASVVCPIMYTDENINTAMLKRMAADELDKKDTKVFAIPPGLAPEMAFDLAEAAVQHHDVRLVREFAEKDPFVGEAWYYGKAKGREDKLVVRARVLGEKRVLEFFVASGSTLMLTGMLAELKADLNRELEAQKGRPEMKQITGPEDVKAVAMVRTLLDKAAELEQAAGETDIGR